MAFPSDDERETNDETQRENTGDREHRTGSLGESQREPLGKSVTACVHGAVCLGVNMLHSWSVDL